MTLKQEKIRTELESSVLQLFDEGGLEAVKARTLAKRVGISVGSIYNLYGSVDKLIEKVNFDLLGQFQELGNAASKVAEVELQSKIKSGEVSGNDESMLRYRLLGLARTYVDFVANNENRWAAMLAFNQNRAEGEAGEAYLDQQGVLLDLIGAVLSGSPVAQGAQDTRLAARCLWSAVHGIIALNFVGQVSEISRKQCWAQIELLVSNFVRGIYAANLGNES